MWEIVQVNESMLALKKKKNSVENEKKILNVKHETSLDRSGEAYPGLARWALNVITCILIRETVGVLREKT